MNNLKVNARVNARFKASAIESRSLSIPLRPLQLGSYRIDQPVLVAPMAGVTDRPYRQLCRRFGASYAVSEMAASNPALWKSVKTSQRLNHDGEAAPVAVQLAGADPRMMAQAARYNADRGAQVIDINMGCPAKKVCALAAGSALMGQEPLALRIVEAVIEALANRERAVPVTVKMRTGICAASRNVQKLALAMQSLGVSMIVVHGRTREQGFNGEAEYDSLQSVKAALQIPVIANGDIDSAEKAAAVLKRTGCDGVMVGRAALGRPWLFAQIAAELMGQPGFAEPGLESLRNAMQVHFDDHMRFYGEPSGVRSFRKHVSWYLPQWVRISARQLIQGLPAQDWAQEALQRFFRIESSARQWVFIEQCFACLIQGENKASDASSPRDCRLIAA